MLKIGNIEIKNGLALAPMAGITDVSFRKLCIRYGASLTVSEMISAKGVYYKDKKTAALAASSDGESPFALQLFGSDPEIMGIAAEQLLTTGPDLSIEEVSGMTGFESSTYFRRIFKQHTGLSPREYRRRQAVG